MALRLFKVITVGNAATTAAGGQTATAYQVVKTATDRSCDFKTINAGTGVTISDDAAGNLTFAATTAGVTGGTITGATISGNIMSDTKRCTTQLDAATNTVLANVTGITGFTLAAGATYRYRIDARTTCGGTGGVKFAFNLTTATLAAINYDALGYTAAAVAQSGGTTTANQTSLIASNTAFTQVVITGTFTTTLGGTLDLQFAENSSNATSSVLVGSTMELVRIA